MPGIVHKPGPCYVCGRKYTKGYMKRHVLSEHYNEPGDQRCSLMLISDEYSSYWVLIDMPVTSTLLDLDRFLREIWLECCGHTSAFMHYREHDRIDKNKTLDEFSSGHIIQYEYDPKCPTRLFIAFVKKVYRPAQEEAVRVMGRNDPYRIICQLCRKREATEVAISAGVHAYCCKKCAEEHAGEYSFLPVVNSPRTGICKYRGQEDRYGYKNAVNDRKP